MHSREMAQLATGLNSRFSDGRVLAALPGHADHSDEPDPVYVNDNGDFEVHIAVSLTKEQKNRALQEHDLVIAPRHPQPDSMLTSFAGHLSPK